MNSQEKLEVWKRKIVDLEEEIKELESGRIILANILDEMKAKHTLKLEIFLEGIDLEEEISYLNDWIDFHKNKVRVYSNKIDSLSKKDEIAAEVHEAAKKAIIKFSFSKAIETITKYSVPFIILLLIVTSFFLLKPAITGQVVLNKEATHADSLNLRINESGTYEWTVKSPGDIKYIKATGNVKGNGTVRMYIEKDGKRYPIYTNK